MTHTIKGRKINLLHRLGKKKNIKESDLLMWMFQSVEKSPNAGVLVYIQPIFMD